MLFPIRLMVAARRRHNQAKRKRRIFGVLFGSVCMLTRECYYYFDKLFFQLITLDQSAFVLSSVA